MIIAPEVRYVDDHAGRHLCKHEAEGWLAHGEDARIQFHGDRNLGLSHINILCSMTCSEPRGNIVLAIQGV